MSDSKASWRMFIPTRDSARYVGVFLEHYRAIGMEPLYIVDGRSRDDTFSLLQSMRADAHLITPTSQFGVTELVEAACRISGANWVLRMDDDEFPSRRMLRFISVYVAAANPDGNEKIYFNREWVKTCNGEFVFFRSPRHMRGKLYDGQVRLFPNRNLTFEHHIHTAGVVTKGWKALRASTECFIVHFDALLKSTDEKLAKIRRYEKLEPGSGWTFPELYLPELYSDRQAFIIHRHNLDQFLPLIEALPKFANDQPAPVTDEELQLVAKIYPRGLRLRGHAPEQDQDMVS